jgi:hypothetical protein
MKCLSVEECQSWLAPSGLILDEYHRLQAVEGNLYPPLYVVTQKYGGSLPELSRELLDWMPVGRERLLIVSDWWNYPPDKSAIFETIRRGCGVSQSLSDAPGHLFISTKDSATHYEDRPSIDVEEEAVAMWLMGMMLEWTWNGYAVVKGCRDAVWLGDDFVGFLSADAARLEAANSLIAERGLKSSNRFPWQPTEPKPVVD